MKESIKMFSGIAGSMMVRWGLMIGLGCVLCFIGVLISIILIANNGDSGYAGASSGGIISLVTTFLFLFVTEFWSAFLLVASLLFTTIYFSIANKYTLHLTVYKVWQLKGNNFLKEKIEVYGKKLSEASPNWLKEMGSPVKVKLKLMDQIKNDQETNVIQKRILRFGLKMIKLDDVNFSQDNLRFSEIIFTKIDQYISTMSNPTLKGFYVALFVHLCLIIIAFIFDK
jgi:membrane-bound ClpP family serine protease